jgi:plasmid stabilization system protein ParE
VKIVFLASARQDLDWYVEYYANVFPEGGRNAKQRYLKTKALLRRFPEAGRKSEEDGLHELVIQKTPFMFVYAIQDAHIEILRLWDQRARRPKLWRSTTNQKKK